MAVDGGSGDSRHLGDLLRSHGMVTLVDEKACSSTEHDLADPGGARVFGYGTLGLRLFHHARFLRWLGNMGEDFPVAL